MHDLRARRLARPLYGGNLLIFKKWARLCLALLALAAIAAIAALFVL